MADHQSFLFLRAINVGKRKISMNALRNLLLHEGFTAVRTHLNTGNVVFETAPFPAAAIEQACESLLYDQFGFPVTVFYRKEADVRAILDEARAVLPSDPADSLYVTFMKEEVPAVQPLPSLSDGTIRVVRMLGTTVLTQTSPIPNGTSFPNPFIERQFRCEATSRNIRVIDQLCPAS